MNITFDPQKNEQNRAKHGVSFEQVAECDWSMADIRRDTRYDYGEPRFIAFLPLNGRLHNVVFTTRDEAMRIISFRKANAKEIKHYGNQ